MQYFEVFEIHRASIKFDTNMARPLARESSVRQFNGTVVASNRVLFRVRNDKTNVVHVVETALLCSNHPSPKAYETHKVFATRIQSFRF